MLDNDPVVDSLLAVNPFHGQKPPKFVRALHFDYKFTKLGDTSAKAGKWWTRKAKKGEYLPPVAKEILEDAYKKFGWRWKKEK